MHRAGTNGRAASLTAASFGCQRYVEWRGWAGKTIQLRVEALDEHPGSLIEAGVDSVTIVRQ